MRRSFTSFFRLIATMLVITVMTSGIAMAGYACPEATKARMHAMTGDEMPCIEMDMEKPVHCAKYQAGTDLALEHSAASPLLSVITVHFVIPAPPLVAPILVFAAANVTANEGTGPPYLRTLRLRI